MTSPCLVVRARGGPSHSHPEWPERDRPGPLSGGAGDSGPAVAAQAGDATGAVTDARRATTAMTTAEAMVLDAFDTENF